MTRLVDTLTTQAPGSFDDTPIVDLKQGGQFGHMMDYKALVSATPYVRQHVIPVLIQSPRGIEHFENPQAWHRSIKALIEEQSHEITGLDQTLSISNVEHDVGGAGEKVSAVSNVTRAVSEPTHAIYEKYNMPASRLINTWITDLMMDPETKYPNIITRESAEVTDHLLDFYSCTVLYIEPDPVFKNVLKAWLCTFVRPATEGPQMQGSRQLTTDKEDLTVDLRMTATTQIGWGVNKLATTILQTLSVANTNPHQRPAMYDDIEAKVKAVDETGYAEGMEEASKVALKR